MPARSQSGITTSLPSMRSPVPGALAQVPRAYLRICRLCECQSWHGERGTQMSRSQAKRGRGGHFRGWKSQRGVRADQSVRTVQHVLVNMLENKVTDFTPPKGLSRMSIGDRRIWDEQEGRWYRGAPPLPGSCHRTSMEPELPNTGQVPRFWLLTMDQKQTQ